MLSELSNEMPDIGKNLNNLFYRWKGEYPDSFYPLPPSGSYRKYFRMTAGGQSAIGAYNPDSRENATFIHLSKHFRKQGIRCPEIYLVDTASNTYLLQDLGDTTLLNYIGMYGGGPGREVDAAYRKALEDLIQIQIEGARGLDFSQCYPRSAFDEQSIRWDLNYFKYHFLKLARIPFDEQLLAEDFTSLTNYLLQAESNFFLYRDFQSRNIMVQNDELWYIDYQGGRRGALQYDLGSLLFESKTFLPFEMREELVQHYIEVLSKNYPVDTGTFMQQYPAWILIRLLQALGAYGFRGLHENKLLFLQSIPYAIQNLEYITNSLKLDIDLPEMDRVFNNILKNMELRKLGSSSDKPTLRIRSFSYRNGIPFDETLNGGGFVFDCRSLPNPGRLEEYKAFTGKDEKVISFFRDKTEVDRFLSNVFGLIDSAIDDYLSRGLKDMMISFGCTGGQHRSVYCAESLARHVNEKYEISVDLRHLVLPLNMQIP
jgi:aminoglycoside/choline kinase family phosphotransferase